MHNLMNPGHPTLPPGFRFHPTDEELLTHYLKKKASSCPLPVPIIADIDLYKFDPWELPGKASFGEHEWYFFSPRDRKYPNGVRPNRAAASGYWKATGTDKPIMTSSGGQKIGVKKALVFYRGRPPKGMKTNWIMHEFRLTGDSFVPKPTLPFTSRRSLRLDDWVLCRIYKKIPHGLRPCGSKESEETECVKEVMASLPDAAHQKYSNLPKLGSCGVWTDADPFLESILTDPEAPNHVLSHQYHHPQMEVKSNSSINGDEKYACPSSIRYACIPCPPGPTLKSELIDNADAKGSTHYTCTNDYLFGKSLFSLPNLTEKRHFHQHRLDLSGDDLEQCYKWQEQKKRLWCA